MNKKLEEILSTSKLNELIRKSEKQEEKKSKILWVLAIVGAVAAVAGIAYGDLCELIIKKSLEARYETK